MIYKQFLVLVFFTSLQLPLYAQSSQIAGLPMQTNPSFAGNVGVGRISFSCHDFLGSHGTYIDYGNNISYDFFLEKLRSGIGFKAGQAYSKIDLSDRSDSNVSESSSAYVGFIVAPKFPLKGKYTFSPSVGIDYSYSHNRNLRLEALNTLRTDYMKISLGFLFNTKRFYTGISYSNVLNTNRPYSWDGTFLLGWVIQRTDESNFSFCPSVIWYFNNTIGWVRVEDANEIFEVERKFSWASLLSPDKLNLNFRYKRVLWGIGSSFMIGYQSKNTRFRIMACFSTKYRQELVIRYLFNKKKSNNYLNFN